MDGVINPILDRLAALEKAMAALHLAVPPDVRRRMYEGSESLAADATTLNPMRIPSQPGMPIPNYNADTQGYDDATEDAMAAEAAARLARSQRQRKAAQPRDTVTAPDRTVATGDVKAAQSPAKA